MKRLIKLLSIFGVLIILGSCSSSKSVNVSTVTGDTKYVKFVSLYSSTYPVQYLTIDGGDYDGDTYFFAGDDIKIDTSVKYTISWVVLDKVSTSSTYGNFITSTKSNCNFQSDKTTLTIALGNTSSLYIPQE